MVKERLYRCKTVTPKEAVSDLMLVQTRAEQTPSMLISATRLQLQYSMATVSSKKSQSKGHK